MGRVSQRQNGEKMRLGVKQVLTVVKLVDFGVYLGSDEERVLLPKKQVPAMKKRLTEKYDIVFEAEDADGENVPVALQNSRFGAAGETVRYVSTQARRPVPFWHGRL